MKIKVFLGIQVLIASAFFVISCSSSKDEINNSAYFHEDEYIKIPIRFSGEIKTITEGLLTKTEEKKNWYAFQLHSLPEDSSDVYRYYAYGFLDYKENMIVDLKTGYKQGFDEGMVVDGSEEVRYFCLYNAGWTSIGNSFFVSPTGEDIWMKDICIYVPKLMIAPMLSVFKEEQMIIFQLKREPLKLI